MNATPLTRRWTQQERETIANYLREMAGDTHLLLHLAEANMCADIAAIVRGAALQLEQRTHAGSRPEARSSFSAVPH